MSPVHYVFNTKTNNWALLNISNPNELSFQNNKSIKLSVLVIMDRASGIQNHTNSKTSEHHNINEKLKKLREEKMLLLFLLD